MRLLTDLMKWLLRQPRWRLVLAAAVIVIGGFFLFRSGSAEQNGITFNVRRGPLDIHILEGGGIEALESQEIRSEIKGLQGTKILKIVDEGYLVTEDDVKNGKVLVEFDSSDIQQKIITEEIQFQSTLAALTEAQQAYDIQLNLNITDIKAAEQKAKFARMDFQKFMGEKAALEILQRLDMEDEPWTNALSAALAMGHIPMPDGFQNGKLLAMTNLQSLDELFKGMVSEGLGMVKTSMSSLPTSASGETNHNSFSNAITQIDFTKYADTNVLGDGAANQQLRKLQDDVLMSKTEKGQAQTKFEGTKRLAEKQFVTKIELENDQIAVDKADLKQKTADTSLALFIKYEFPKSAEEFLSKYDEALRALERTRKEAVSKLAQAQAKLKSSEGRFKIEAAQRADLYNQLERCIIRARKTGLVVYASPNDRWDSSESIREGATVRERQRIITIPDMTQMAVRIKIHESNIKRVQRGLKAKITVDAFPDEKLSGEVYRVSVLPDSQNRWMSDLKVYITYVSIDGAREWIKPGMSAKVEIMVKRLPDVLYIPLQAVSYSQGKQVCYVARGNSSEERVIEVGEFSDEFIEVKKGLKEGEAVLLRAPEGSQDQTDEPGKPEEIPTEPNGKVSPPPAAGPTRSGGPGGGGGPGAGQGGPSRQERRERPERPSGPREPRGDRQRGPA